MQLQVNNLYKNYKKKQALININILLQNGVYGLLGENGAGKSTFIRILTTIDFPSKGKILYNGQDILELDVKYRDILGYVPQDFNVFPSFTAYKFLEYIGTLKGISKNNLYDKISMVLKFVNLEDVAHKKVSSFSGGMKRRVGIASAIINDPKIIILDEPTAGLDPKERIRLANIISAMTKDKIVILSTHILSDIEAIADQLIIIKSGKLIEFNKIDTLTKQIRGQVFETTVDEKTFSILNSERKIIQRKQDGKNIKVRYVGEIFSQANDNKEVEPTLEDYYVSSCL